MRVRIPKGMGPLIRKYEEQISKLASRVVHEVTGEPKTEQWSADVEPLGAGSWGVVYPLADERFIVKVTSDPTEGPIVATIMSESVLHNHMGIIHYFALRRLPEDVTHRNVTRAVYVIIAERLKDVGRLPAATLYVTRDSPETTRRDHALAKQLSRVKDAATSLVKEKQRKRSRQYVVDRLDEEYMDLVGRVNDGPISDFFFQFRDVTGDGVLADVHLNNVGKRAVNWEEVTDGEVPLGGGTGSTGSDWHWVISDPGHSSIEEHPTIAELKENPRSRR